MSVRISAAVTIRPQQLPAVQPVEPLRKAPLVLLHPGGNGGPVCGIGAGGSQQHHRCGHRAADTAAADASAHAGPQGHGLVHRQARTVPEGGQQALAAIESLPPVVHGGVTTFGFIHGIPSLPPSVCAYDDSCRICSPAGRCAPLIAAMTFRGCPAAAAPPGAAFPAAEPAVRFPPGG